MLEKYANQVHQSTDDIILYLKKALKESPKKTTIINLADYMEQQLLGQWQHKLIMQSMLKARRKQLDTILENCLEHVDTLAIVGEWYIRVWAFDSIIKDKILNSACQAGIIELTDIIDLDPAIAIQSLKNK